MLASVLLAVILPLVGPCLARTIEVESDFLVQKRTVDWHRCNTPYAKDVVHITKWVKEPITTNDDNLRRRSELIHMLDSRDLQSDMITKDFENKKQEITAQVPIYLGLTGEKNEEGHDILGQVSNVDDAPTFQFLSCPVSDFMGYLPIDKIEMDVVYGHLTLASNPNLCVQPSALSKRNAAIVLKPCPTGEDSQQFEAYFKFNEYRRLSNGVTTILSYMEFLGKAKRFVPNHFEAHYSIRFDQLTSSVSIDARAPNEKMGKGEKSVFSFNNRRKAK